MENSLGVYFEQPFGVRHLGAAAGIMVTASHNPKDDNGYKVYWGNGCQIIPPHDVGIAAAILDNLDPWDIEIAQVCSPELGISFVQMFAFLNLYRILLV